MTSGKLVEVYRAANSVEAHLVRSVLTEAGIDAQISGEALEGSGGEILGWAAAPQLLVPESDYHWACEIMESLQAADR